jgi:undecaprenyl-diphosphatase
MKIKGKIFLKGLLLIVAFIIWTCLIQTLDVQPIGQNRTDVGFATFNSWFHKIIGVNMILYTITDWLGLVPLFVCMMFACVGFVQLIKRKRVLKVDFDIILLGIYYVVVIFGYLIFEMIPINYRPVLINGVMEASYPSSTTLLVLSVMPTLVFQVKRRLKNHNMRKIITILAYVFSAFMVIGRLVSGVHWFTDIVGSVFISAGLYYMYKAVVLLIDKGEFRKWNFTKNFRN